MVTTLQGYLDSLTVNVMGKVPLQTYETAAVLASNYLSSVGGWVPDDVGAPTGFGHAANLATVATAGVAVQTQNYQRIYAVGLVVNAVLNITQHVNLATGLSDPSVLAAFQTTLQAWIDQQLAHTNIKCASITSFTGTVTNGGQTLTAARVAINTAVLAGGQLLDPRHIALKEARTRYTLDTTWNVASLYTQTTDVIVVIVKKYTSTSYATLDGAQTNQVIITLSPTSYSLLNGCKVPILS